MWVIEAALLAAGIDFGLAACGAAIGQGLKEVAAALATARPAEPPQE
jgi:F0F1-type ATP synthase membrane subunit c/vacuolar-type H+-ATPase subunit K